MGELRASCCGSNITLLTGDISGKYRRKDRVSYGNLFRLLDSNIWLGQKSVSIRKRLKD